MSSAIIEIKNLSKVYEGGFRALDQVSLDVNTGEILALLGPNGAGKTTLISIICGLVNRTSGSVRVGGYDTIAQYRKARSLIGLVPQELNVDTFETVFDTVNFSRGVFGKPANKSYAESILKDLSLLDKKNSKILTLSGGMKRRVMIAKALAHEPRILFLDEPTAGVDVELRKDMWQMVRRLRQNGVTVILTTHYIEEAEEMADRVGIISEGKLILTEDKTKLLSNLGTKELRFQLTDILEKLPSTLEGLNLSLKGNTLLYNYDAKQGAADIPQLIEKVARSGLRYTDIETAQKSLEEIFVELVRKK